MHQVQHVGPDVVQVSVLHPEGFHLIGNVAYVNQEIAGYWANLQIEPVAVKKANVNSLYACLTVMDLT